MELPRLTLKPNILRFVFPRALGLLLLCSLFYVLLIINLKFLFKEVEQAYFYIALVFILVIWIAGIAIEYIKANNWLYHFFNDRVEFRTSSTHPEEFILYNEATEVALKQNIFDRIFGTATIILKPSFEIRFIKYTNNTYFYVQKLVERSRKLREIVK
ncbi:TPA: hypothetical protein HA246_00475 [Candidatus Woesearchaeota archaeon]|nr:hypothetical protein [Candidatus Woesearchaeota archaeon]